MSLGTRFRSSLQNEKQNNGETLNIQEVREYMITSLDNIIKKLRRNKSILQEGGVLENEHWADIAVAFREATYYFANQQFYKHEK